MDRNFVVYIHTNKTNGKRYIGITGKSKAKYRWGRNGSGYSKNIYFNKAIKKYGWDGFRHEIFAENLTKDEALRLETMLIIQYNSNDDKHGYNCTTGGEYPTIREETLIKKRNSMLGKNRGSKSGVAKAVICLENRNIYDSINIAKQETNIDVSSIIKVCNHKQCTAGGLHWMYLNDYRNTDIDEIIKILESKPNRKGRSGIKKKVICLNNNKIYSSIIEASNDLNLNPRAISDVLNNKRKSTKGYKFVIYNS